MAESKFQHDLIKKIEKIFPKCIILKNDPSYIQGIPDLLILWKDKWASLECKDDISKMNSSSASLHNQKYYVRTMNQMSFSRFIYPQNEEEVLDELQQAFRS